MKIDIRSIAAILLIAAPGAHAADAFALAQRSGCLSCHRGAESHNGPAFRDVAARYAGRDDAVPVLARHIVEGTGPAGLGWMKQAQARLPFMPPNAMVSPDDARLLAQWVLGVRKEFTDFSRFVSERVAVAGAVKKALDLDLAALRRMPQQTVSAPLPDGGVQQLQGVLLRDLLREAGLDAQSHHDPKKSIVVATASDGYRVVFSWAELLASPIGEGALLILARDGQPLDNGEGRIALVSAQDRQFGSRYLKWLKTIDVRRIVD